VFFTCFRDRLVLGIPLVSLATSEICGSLPAIMAPYNPFVRKAKLALFLFALLLSSTMLIQSARAPKPQRDEPQASFARQVNKGILIAFAIVATILVLGSLLYFFPSAAMHP
jgi:hypothetical protein